MAPDVATVLARLTNRGHDTWTPTNGYKLTYGLYDTKGKMVGWQPGADPVVSLSSLGVNPSLTIAAVSERCADALVFRAGDLGLPARPAHFAPGIPSEIVGERVFSSVAPETGASCVLRSGSIEGIDCSSAAV